MASFITYSAENLMALRQHDVQPPRADYRYCIRFDDFDRGLAAWIADASARQAITAFGGVDVYSDITNPSE